MSAPAKLSIKSFTRGMFFAALVASMTIPFLFLGISSFARLWFFPALLPREFSVRAWQYVASDSAGILPALWMSIVIALVVTVLAVLIALPAARALALCEFRGKRLVTFLLMLPVIAPPLAATMGVHGLFLRYGLTDSILGVVLVHLIPSVPYATLMLASSFANFDTDIEAQARTLGANHINIWLHVTLPAVAPALAVATVFAFLISWSQYLTTLFIGGGQILTLPLILVGFQRSGDEAVTSALSLIFLLPTLFVLFSSRDSSSMTRKPLLKIPGAHVETARTQAAFLIACVLCLLSACARTSTPTGERATLTPERFAAMSWDDVLTRARGTTVNFAMWAGDEARNRYFQARVAVTLKQKYDITLRLTPLNDTIEVVNRLLNEKGAGRTGGGAVDMIWINGENFRTAKQAGVLWGAFAEHLPNIKYYDEAARSRDFGTPIEGYEAPWQKAQFVLAYDAARFPEPPRSVEALRAWLKSHPGRFTYIAPPDFTGSVFLRHILYNFGGGAQSFQNGFDEELYRHASAATFEYLNDIKPYLWRRGDTYPATPKDLDRLFVNNEVDFTFAYGASYASERIRRGEYPPTVRTFLFDTGTIGNYNFLAVPFNASNTAGALVLINHLMSPEHLLEQTRTLGGVFPLALDKLSAADRRALEDLPRSEATLPLDVLTANQLPEADAEYLERLEKDWREKVLRR